MRAQSLSSVNASVHELTPRPIDLLYDAIVDDLEMERVGYFCVQSVERRFNTILRLQFSGEGRTFFVELSPKTLLAEAKFITTSQLMLEIPTAKGTSVAKWRDFIELLVDRVGAVESRCASIAVNPFLDALGRSKNLLEGIVDEKYVNGAVDLFSLRGNDTMTEYFELAMLRYLLINGRRVRWCTSRSITSYLQLQLPKELFATCDLHRLAPPTAGGVWDLRSVAFEDAGTAIVIDPPEPMGTEFLEVLGRYEKVIIVSVRATVPADKPLAVDNDEKSQIFVFDATTDFHSFHKEYFCGMFKNGLKHFFPDVYQVDPFGFNQQHGLLERGFVFVAGLGREWPLIEEVACGTNFPFVVVTSADIISMFKIREWDCDNLSVFEPLPLRKFVALLESSSVVLDITENQGSAFVTAHALFAGKPIVSSGVEVDGELSHPYVNHGDNGYLNAGFEKEAFIHFVSELMEDPLRRQEMGHRSMELRGRADIHAFLQRVAVEARV